MTLRLPFLALVLIAVGLVLSGATYMRFSIDPPENTPQEIAEEESEVVEEEGEDVQNEEEAGTPPAPSSGSPVPTPAPTPKPEAYTMANVRTHASATSCWTVINGNVYDLTAWISRHPGGKSAITGLCGRDGTASFESEHEGDSKAESRLAGFLLGPLE